MQLAERKKVAAADAPEQKMSELASFIRSRWSVMRNHRQSANSGGGAFGSMETRLLEAMRMFNGQYSPEKLAEIRKFNGSDVYARLVAVKCRGATSLLREVYLGAQQPWGIEPTPKAVIPDDVSSNVINLAATEAAALQVRGMPVTPDMIKARTDMLMDAAQRAAVKKAAKEADEAELALNDVLVEGRFYESLAQFLVDLPLFPFAALKGPTVRMVWSVKWVDGKPVMQRTPRMFWDRISPFDLYWTPGANDASNCEFIERVRYSRSDLNAVMDLPGYNQANIRAVLDEFGRKGVHDWMAGADSERAVLEGREIPNQNQSFMIDAAEYHGAVQGRMLEEFGFTKKELGDDLDKDVFVQAWLIDRWIIKVQMTPSPRKRPPYYLTSFEKVPGTMAGNALPDILSDIQDVCNAALRSLVNNMAIASGPQVVIDTSRLAPGQALTADTLYPWKRWFMTQDPLAGSSKPVDFFQPQSRAAELLGVYKEFTNIADELSAIPRYITGTERLGGAGRTASGLSMLMNNANKILQTVASNIDNDVIGPVLDGLYDMVMLADAGVNLRGDEEIRVRGVQVAIEKETERQRQLEFIRLTTNPIDAGIMGAPKRANLLRKVADGIGIPGEDVVPTEEELEQQARMQAYQQVPGMGPQGGGGEPPPAATGDQPPQPGAVAGPRTNTVQSAGGGGKPPTQQNKPPSQKV